MDEMLKSKFGIIGWNIFFILIGTGPEEPKIVALLEKIGIDDYFHLAGRQYDVTTYLMEIDIAVNCSEKEGLSNAIIEYMAAGIPIIASNAGGNPELIKNYVNGLIFTLNDHQELARKIILLLDDDSLKSLFIKNSYSSLKSFDINKMLMNHKKLYMSLS